MYLPRHFEQTDIGLLHQLIRANPLATLVTLGAGGLEANHIPLQLLAEPAPFGTLRGHVARANPVWREFSPEVQTLAIFHGPGAYITPSWYATKQETGKVVPTWNYVAVHAYGALRVIDDAAWLRAQLTALTVQQESAFSRPWQVSDAPHTYTEKLIEAIVGIEIVITRLSGKWKVSQNQPERNRDGVLQGLARDGSHASLAMAELIRSAKKDVD